MVVDDLKDETRMSHSLCRFDRHGFSFVYHRCLLSNNDMEGNRHIGAIINGRIMIGYLSFTYRPTCTL